MTAEELALPDDEFFKSIAIQFWQCLVGCCFVIPLTNILITFFGDYILSLLERENNDVNYDKEKDEDALRVAISEQLSGRARSTSSKTTLSEDQK